MKVTIVSATQNPMEVASLAAGLCYGKTDYSPKRVKNCVGMGHTSIIEHCVVTFLVEGISRACSHQLVRHRIASYNQESQRYCKYDLSGNDWFVMPPKYRADEMLAGSFLMDMDVASASYMEDVNDFEMKPEDARYQLPEATKTRLIVTMNARELYSFLGLRDARDAQWEIREMAQAIEAAICGINEQWETLMSFRKETRICCNCANCEIVGFDPEKEVHVIKHVCKLTEKNMKAGDVCDDHEYGDPWAKIKKAIRKDS